MLEDEFAFGFNFPEWHKDAACAEYADQADLWFPARGESLKKPMAVCQRCLVQSDCLAWALDHPEQLPGLWGGSTERERKRLKASGVTGDLVRQFGVHAVAGQREEREREIDEAVDRLRLAV